MDCRKKAGKPSQLNCFKLAAFVEIPNQPMPGFKTLQNLEPKGFYGSALQDDSVD